MYQVTVRHSRPGDDRALARLAALDSANPPRGPALIAESEGRMLAALPLDGGRAIADPFARTGELVALLELRAAQLSAAAGPRRSWWRRPVGLARSAASWPRERSAADGGFGWR